MTYSELANFIEHEMKMAQVYQPVMLGLMLESEAGVVTEAEGHIICSICTICVALQQRTMSHGLPTH